MRPRYHLPGADEAAAAEIAKRMREPEGTVMLGGTYPGIHDPTRPDGVLAEVVTGAHVFRVVRGDAGKTITAIHATPGSGTRIAQVTLASPAPSDGLRICLAWSPEVLRLMIFDRTNPNRSVSAVGAPAESELWVDADGEVVEIGGPGVNVMGVAVYSSGRRLVSPPAIHLWRETLEAANIALSGESPEGYAFDVIVSNFVLSMVVTGFETYSETRFREVDLEGVAPNCVALLRRFGSFSERRLLDEGQTLDVLDGSSDPLPYLIGQINFQSYDENKRAWNKGYGIKFGELDVDNVLLERMQRLLRYRHRVVHVSPMLSTLNGPETPPEEPEFSNPDFAREAIASFTRFIEALHDATLALRQSVTEPTAIQT